jgi:hypothetical protein
MSNAIEEYKAALDRLIKNTPIIVPKYTKINKDTVSLEAGRKRGSIKKSRPEHEDLILLIDNSKNNDLKLIEERNYYKEQYFNALNRELLLLDRLKELEKSDNSYITKKVSVQNFVSK